ncbi:MAG: NAD(P)H-dependent oxidoreductase [Patescibacteria group bacterium]|nr:NAD(P)H-dependent oxidoreductase [Patescibacteria group bacterium]
MKTQIIVGSTREGRFAEKPAQWLLKKGQSRGGAEFELLDLRDYPLPFFSAPVSPSMAKEDYTDPPVIKWTQKVSEGDGYIIVSPEYNHSFPAVLKNALDWVWGPWQKKPVGFLSYGSSLGARAIEQLRLVVIELGMVPSKLSLQIPREVFLAARQGEANPFMPLEERADAFLDEILWWTKILKDAREN